MGSGRRMCWIQLLLVNLASFSSLISLAGGSPMEVMSAPNMLHVGTTENIFVEIQDCTREDDINVQISVMNFPTKHKLLASTSVTLTKTKNYQDFGSIKIPTEDFSKDPDMRQFVYLRAEFPGRVLESVVLVSFQSGYIFIQTDKPIYTQGSTVRYRVFGLTTDMKLVENEGQMEDLVTIEIVTSEGITIDSTVMRLRSGIIEGQFYLPSIISYGLWKVVAKFNSNPQQIFDAEFEVKEYVLPSFEVELTPSTPFFYVDSESLTVNIKAMYTFGEEVDGAAYVVFGIINNGNKSSFPSSPQRVPIQRGAGVVKLMRHHITQTFPNINEIMGSSIYVAVSVLAENGGEMVEAEMTTIKIVTSPYTIHFKRTRKYFQPGMAYGLMIEVVNPDGSPAPYVAVVVNPGNVQGRTSANGIAKVTINTAPRTETMSITARTNDLTLASQRQASASMTAHSYKAKSNNYLLINVDVTEVEVGNFMKFGVFLNRPESQEKDITYLILSKGQLVKHNRYKNQGQPLVSLMLQITKDMLPSFRIVAYYHTDSDEVVSDSVWVDVKDSCMGSLKLESVRPLSSYEPRKAFKLKIVGDPEAKVGLVVADKNAYVLSNKLHLTQKKIWDTVEKFDTGCTPGGGKDSMSVFYDAGLLFETKAFGTPDRTDVMCPDSSRRKRSINVMNFRTRLVNQYEGRGQRECCLDGMRDIPVAYTCERRSEYIVDGPACIEAFMHCCKEMERQQVQKKQGNHSLARSKRAEGDDDDYIENYKIISRTHVYESWHWTLSVLDACPYYYCKSMTLVKHLPLPDSVTTWQLTGISVSRSHGICVSDPLEVRVYKSFFIELRLPYSAVRGEQLEIKAILHNYSPEPVTVRVELKKENNLCSTAYKQGWYRQIIQIGAQTSRSVPFIILPMKDGEIPIEVKAAVKHSYLSDGIRKVLHVVPAGKLMKSVKTVTLNPAQGVDGKQVTTINSKIPLRHVAPNTPSTTLISLTGQMSRPVEAVMSGDSLGELIIEPSGSGEENMIGTTLPVIATIFLDQTNQWKFLASKKRNDALRHIMKGYQNELAYRKTDGSFSGVSTEPGSTWLTAYVAKVFSMASDLVVVERSVICDAIRFLILSSQQLDGMFIEKGRVINSKMTGDVTGTDWDASLTAFCLIALQESRRICSESVNMMPVSINRSTDYLEQRLRGLISPYAVAMTSYALATENKLNKEILYKFAAPDRSHWPVEKGNVYTLEATAYALLALVKAKAFEEAKHVVKWLVQQERLNGGYGSTQATVTVYQAVAEYWTRAKDLEYNMKVEMSLPGVASSYIYKFNEENQHVTRVSKLNSINKDVKVAITGTGKATLKMESLYYMPPTEKTDCDNFNLTVQLLPERISDNEKIYKLKIEVLYKEKPSETAVSILEVGLPTGFTPNKRDLELLSNGRDQIISKYDMRQSERGSLIIYLNEISHTRPQEISFRIHQEMKVGILQPAAVSVYNFFDKEKPCVQFYHPERSGALIQLCSNNQCVCAEENCSKLKKNVENEDRVTKICEVTHNFRVTFAYKVRVEEFREELSSDIYSMRIIDIIKPGGIDANPKGQLRPFLSTKICRDALDLRENKTYLIMGSSKHILKDEERYQYLLSERTWIEYWPTDAECHTEQFRGICNSIEETISEYTIWGCKM